MDNALIIFIKNPVKGKVKTRLAATIGDDMALAIYQKLIKHTLDIVKDVAADKFIFFSNTIDETIGHKNTPVHKAIQFGNDLGEKMKNAFERLFKSEYKCIIIIGTDCPGITSNILLEAFSKLNNNDVVIGPAMDGGYYLIGMKEMYGKLFEDISWSTSTVLHSTIERCKINNWAYALLTALSDVDEEKDLVHLENLINLKMQKTE
ncbi:MAG: TIGR04282 family arsenosugar biosynthesis glycosyltransferase [Ferruginibacter sp.]|nr:TIGR04282 family arsenosugar biosynthesis glycosyltransferase [Ferruginibacter sp.]